MRRDKLKEILLLIKEQKAKEDNVKDVLGFDVKISFYEKHWEVLEILLKELLSKTTYDEVQWWLYEDVEKVYTKDGIKINVENVDDFLDFVSELS